MLTMEITQQRTCAQAVTAAIFGKAKPSEHEANGRQFEEGERIA